MTTGTACKPRIIGSPPVFTSSAGIPHIPTAFPPFRLEITSLTLVRVGGTSLIGGTRIATPMASKQTAGGSTCYSCPRYSAQRSQTALWSEMIHLSIEQEAVTSKESLEFCFSGLGRPDDGHLIGNGLQPPQQDSWCTGLYPCAPRNGINPDWHSVEPCDTYQWPLMSPGRWNSALFGWSQMESVRLLSTVNQPEIAVMNLAKSQRRTFSLL